MVILIYELTLEGKGRKTVALTLGVALDTLRYWFDTKPHLRWAIERARELRSRRLSDAGVGAGGRADHEAFFEYCERKLPEDLVPIWKQVVELAKDEHGSREAVDRLLVGHGKRVRQHLFVHALVTSNFHIGEACRMVNVTRECWEAWQKYDRPFQRLVNKIHTMRKDWAESMLNKLVASGDTTATIFLNKTLNRDRGYDPKIVVKHEGTILNAQLDIDKLPADLKRQVLAWMRGQKPEPANGLERHVETPALPEPVRKAVRGELITEEADDDDDR